MKLSMKPLSVLALAAILLPGAALADRDPVARFLGEVFGVGQRGATVQRGGDDDGARRGAQRGWSQDDDDDDGRSGRDDDDDDGGNDNDDDD